MNELKVFDNKDFGGIRAMQIDGQPWFVGKDVANVLGYEAERNAIKKHVDVEDKLTHQISAAGQTRHMTIINESGLYSLILSSKLPKAKAFKRWVTSEVIPAIRQTGGYIAGDGTELIIKTVMSVLPAIVAETVKAVLPVMQAPGFPSPGVPADAGSASAGSVPAGGRPRKRCINYHGKIDKLPSELRNEIIVMLFTKNYTYLEVSEKLKEDGHDIGLSSVYRYANRVVEEMNRAEDGVRIEG